MPTGTLLVNSGKHKKSTKIDAAALLRAIGAKQNGKGAARKNGKAKAGHRRYARRARTNGKGAVRKNLYAMNKRRTNGKSAVRKNNLYAMNGKGSRKNGKRRSAKRNPAKRTYKRNGALVTNPGSGMLQSITRPAQGLLKKIPLVGNYASNALGLAVGGLGAGLGVLGLHYAMQIAAPYFPEVTRPVGYTLAGSTAAALVAGLAPNFKMKGLVVAGLAAGGVAVDVYRYLHGNSGNLSGGEDYAIDMGADAWGDVDDLGGAGSAHEYSDASLMDAQYMGDGDMTDAEIEAADFGRAHFWRIFRPRYSPGAGAAPLAPNVSHHAGTPGRRWGWLIYLVGMDKFREMAKLPQGERQRYIQSLRVSAIQHAHKFLAAGQGAGMSDAGVAGLLVT